METKKVDKICVMVEVDGQVCSIDLEENVKRLLPGIISSLSGGTLNLIKLSNDYKFDTIQPEDIDPS